MSAPVTPIPTAAAQAGKQGYVDPPESLMGTKISYLNSLLCMLTGEGTPDTSNFFLVPQETQLNVLYMLSSMVGEIEELYEESLRQRGLATASAGGAA